MFRIPWRANPVAVPRGGIHLQNRTNFGAPRGIAVVGPFGTIRSPYPARQVAVFWGAQKKLAF